MHYARTTVKINKLRKNVLVQIISKENNMAKVRSVNPLVVSWKSKAHVEQNVLLSNLRRV